jgi:O-antigen/teichoic acid export membrane protein
VRSKLKSVMSHVGFRRYAINSGWLVGEKVLRLSVGLLVGVWVARYLGPEQFGLFSYVQSFVFLFSVVATLGLDEIVVRELVKDPGNGGRLIGTAFCLKFFGAILTLLILALAVNLTTNDSYTNLLVLIVASATIFQSFNVIDFYYQSKVLSKYTVYSNLLALTLSSLSKITLILLDAPLIAFGIVIMVDAIILAVGLIYFYIKSLNLSLFKWSFSLVTAKSLLRDSWPLILAGFVISIYMKIDQVMIKEMMSVEAVGQYAAAVRLSEAWYFIPMVICGSLFPAIVNARENNKIIYFKRLQRLYTLMVWSGIMIAVPATFFGGWLVSALYGDAYNQATPVLIIHIWAGVFVFLGVAFNKFLTAEALVIKTFYRTFFGALINITLNFLLIPTYGITGAATATLISQFITNVIFDLFDRDLRKYFKMKLLAFYPFGLLKAD